ncbi:MULTISPECIES: hypothetical protein [Moorena]|nr:MULTISPECIES: hypothetical protein [Moorena]
MSDYLIVIFMSHYFLIIKFRDDVFVTLKYQSDNDQEVILVD